MRPSPYPLPKTIVPPGTSRGATAGMRRLLADRRSPRGPTVQQALSAISATEGPSRVASNPKPSRASLARPRLHRRRISVMSATCFGPKRPRRLPLPQRPPPLLSSKRRMAARCTCPPTRDPKRDSRRAGCRDHRGTGPGPQRTSSAGAEEASVGGSPQWWKDRIGRDHSERGARYALIVSIDTSALNVDLWTPVAQQVGVPIMLTP